MRPDPLVTHVITSGRPLQRAEAGVESIGAVNRVPGQRTRPTMGSKTESPGG
jgi:hypothetical protein